MSNPLLLTPVTEDEPCGPDLRWDPEFTRLVEALDAAVSAAGVSVLDSDLTRPDALPFKDIAEMAVRLSARTKDVRVLVIYAEASWRDTGLSAFSTALEDVVAVLEAWPDPANGVHPRADPDDGDLGERAAALGRLLGYVPTLSAAVGWGEAANHQQQVSSSATLKHMFATWSDRLEAAFGDDLPSFGDAWRSLRGILVDVSSQDGETGEEDAVMSNEGVPPQVLDAWDMIDRAVEQLGRQDRHSPALPVLQLLAGWRTRDIVEIADAMRSSGVTLEQLLESVKKQTRRPA